jgi:hypothetical protein
MSPGSEPVSIFNLSKATYKSKTGCNFTNNETNKRNANKEIVNRINTPNKNNIHKNVNKSVSRTGNKQSGRKTPISQNNILLTHFSHNFLFSHLDISHNQTQLLEYANKKSSDDVLELSHVDGFDLHRIHEHILKRLHSKSFKIKEWEKEINQIKEIVKQPQTMIERKKSIQRIRVLQNKIRKVRESQHVKEYSEQAEPLLKEYESFAQEQQVIDFMEDKKKKDILKTEEEKNPEYWKKIRLIKRFVEVAKQYINVQLVQKKRNVYECVCGHNLSEVHIDNLGIQVCPECQTERYIIGNVTGKSESLSIKNDYDDEGNFEKTLIRFQGKQQDKIPNQLFQELDNYFKIRGLPTSEQIKERPLQKDGKKRGTSLELLYKALQETGNSTFYEDANLITHKYWGWKLHDVSHLEAIIMQDYKKTQKVYNRLNKERSSSLGTQYRLFKHLELRGYPCSIKDFKIVKMRESLEYHDDIWKIMCNECGDPEIVFIDTL